MLTADLAAKYARPFGDRDADNLYAAILDEPWADHLRGILADRLEEIGDGDRAAFVRLQLAIASCRMCHRKDGTARNDGYSRNCGRCVPGKARESALLDRYGRAWGREMVEPHLPKCSECFDGVQPDMSRGKGQFRKCPTCHGTGLAASYEFVGGFVGRVTCTLAAFLGARCGECEDRQAWRQRHPGIEPGQLAGGCTCSGRGYTGGLAAALPLVTPVVGWGLADRIPYRYIAAGLHPRPGISDGQSLFRWWCYRNEDEAPWEHQSALLPEAIYEPLRKLMPFPTADAARAALSAACRDLARSWCGLPAWAATGERQ